MEFAVQGRSVTTVPKRERKSPGVLDGDWLNQREVSLVLLLHNLQFHMCVCMCMHSVMSISL